MSSAPLDPPTLDPEVLALLGAASTATLQNQLFARGLRNTYLPGITPLAGAPARFVGEAFTLRALVPDHSALGIGCTTWPG